MTDAKDRRPVAGAVLVFVDKVFDFDIGIHFNGGWHTRTWGRRFDVTHWMPLPPMPIERLLAFKDSAERSRARRARKRSSPP